LDSSWTKIISSFLISVAAWIITYAVLYTCFATLGLAISFDKIIIAIPFLTLGRLFPLTLNGMGTDEVLIIFLFSSNDVSKEPILVAALLYRLILVITPAIAGLLPMLFLKKVQHYNTE
jgi:uncharacterized protein (TIRG00374 family)